MSYTSGGLIEASDYNNFTGSTTGNVSGKINSVWSTGNGNAGYGQTAIPDVSAGNTVTAAQWTNLINALNNARLHQSGVNSGITAPSAGGTISTFSTLSTQLATAYTNRLSASLNGTTVTGSTHTRNITTGNPSLGIDINTSGLIQFSSIDAIRYFFNAGGKFNVIISATDNSGGVERNIQLRDCINAIGGVNNFSGYTNSGRTGTGETLVVNNTNIGYWNTVYLTTSTMVRVATDYADYNGMFVELNAYNADNVTTNGANGNWLWFRVRVVDPGDDSLGGLINITLSARIDIVPPSTTYLSTNSWGTPTITWINL